VCVRANVRTYGKRALSAGQIRQLCSKCRRFADSDNMLFRTGRLHVLCIQITPVDSLTYLTPSLQDGPNYARVTLRRPRPSRRGSMLFRPSVDAHFGDRNAIAYEQTLLYVFTLLPASRAHALAEIKRFEKRETLSRMIQ
jgi:hypothetical protein